MNMTGVLDNINKPNSAPGDYIGEDGLLYCGKCHTPKQSHGTGMLTGRLLSITCACKEKEIEAEAERDRLKRINELRICCLPAKGMREHTFELASESGHIQKSRRYVQKWDKMQNDNIGLLFWGNVGTGKSFTAHCIANALIDQLIPVKIYSTSDLIERLKDRNKRDETLEKCRSAPLLILDDVGAEQDTSYARGQLCQVIDERNESGRPLIVTTNYTMNEIKDCHDPGMQRVFDRLCAMCIPIAIVGESRRREIGVKKLQEARMQLESP